MFTVSHSQLFVPPILLTVYRIYFPSDDLIKVIHLFSGVYLCASILMHSVFFHMLMTACRRWEFFTTLDFEWEVFTGRRPWKWSFTVYLTSRLLALMAVMCNFIGFNLTTEFNCNVSDRSGALRLVLTSLILILRRSGSVVSLLRHGSPWLSPHSFLRFVGK